MAVDSELMTEEGFELGAPALVCRWRLAGGALPLANRHLRALARRTVTGKLVSPELVAWAKQHIEQTLWRGSLEHPEGVLMLIIDREGRAAMTVGPYEPLTRRSLGGLLHRVESSHREAEFTGVAPETLWVVDGDSLIWGNDRDFDSSGSSSLVEDLAHTMGIRVERRELLHEDVKRGILPFDEAFLVSDEHGVVPASDRGGDRGRRFAQSYESLLAKVRDGKR